MNLPAYLPGNEKHLTNAKKRTLSDCSFNSPFRECLQAGVTEKHLNRRGFPWFMITLALSIIKTNPFTCLHFLQAICLVQYIKKVWMLCTDKIQSVLQHLGEKNASPNSGSSFAYCKHSAILKGLQHAEHNGVAKWQALIRGPASKICLPQPLRHSQDMKTLEKEKLLPWLALRNRL